MKKRIKVCFIIGTVCLAGTVILLVLANYNIGFAQWYSVTVYDLLVSCLGRFFGMFPFSVVEILLYLVIAIFLAAAVRLLIKVLKGQRRRENILYFTAAVFCVGSILLFSYTANCGVNYHRTSFSESTGIGADSYTLDDLVKVCILLTEDVNTRASSVQRDEHGVMIHTEALNEEAVEAMEQLAEQYTELEGYYPQPKKLLAPWILSVQQVTGIYSPFTIEANYNGDITDYDIPFSACHELSHLRGFMQEEEANFIAYLACMNSDDVDFQYSGSLRGWISCMNVLYQTDRSKWAEVRVQLSSLAEPDLTANREYWNQYEGKIAEIAETINDNYLKANGQEEGIKSYGRMADLIVDYYS